MTATAAQLARERRLPRWIERVAAAGALPTDSEDERLRKAVLTLLPAMVTPMAVVWVATYWTLGLPVSAAIPFGYQLVSVASLAFYVRTKRFRAFRFSQMAMTLLLPFILQWSLGGFVPSSGVMLWAVIAPLGALMLYGTRQALPWLAAYLTLTLVSGLVDGSLSPASIPDPVKVAFFVLNIGAVSGVSYLLLQYFVRERERATEKSERLLLNVLPGPIAERLKESDRVIADRFEEATVLFADIVDFTPLAGRTSPDDLVRLLDEVFSHFDHLAAERGLEKIKTIGDAYMVAAGIPEPRPDHVEAACDMALAMREHAGRVHGPDGERIAVRIGVDSGPVVAGVIGRSKFIYDLWGDTVNTASRMESHGLPGEIQVTERVARRLAGRYRFRERGEVEVKGKGPVRTYLLSGPP